MSFHGTFRRSASFRSVRVGDVANIVENLDAFHQAARWISEYLAQPHAKLGRSGTVCPFAQSALALDSLRIAVIRLQAADKKAQITEAIQHHLQAFISRAVPENERILQATLMLFPDVSLEEAPELIDQTKEELKPGFIERGLMLGEFHARNESPGLHNPEFRPLRSPIPMLAIRHMVATDLVFLNRSEYDAGTRLRYLEAYLAAPEMPKANREEAERAAEQLRRQ